MNDSFSWLAAVNCVLCGILLTIAVEFYLVHKYVIRPFFTTPVAHVAVEDGDDVKTVVYREDYHAWPANIVTYLKRALEPSGEQTSNENTQVQHRRYSLNSRTSIPSLARVASNSTAQPSVPVNDTEMLWLNACIHRFFVEAIKSNVLLVKLRRKLQEKLNRRTGTGMAASTHSSDPLFGGVGATETLSSSTQPPQSSSASSFFVSYIEVTDISLGDNPPVLSNFALVPNDAASHSLDVSISFDIDYAGGIAVSFVTALNFGLKVPVKVLVSKIAGKMQLRVPAPNNSLCFAVAFAKQPEFTHTIESSILRHENEVMKDLLNSFISKRINSVFMEMFVLPNYRAFPMPLINYNLQFIPELLNDDHGVFLQAAAEMYVVLTFQFNFQALCNSTDQYSTGFISGRIASQQSKITQDFDSESCIGVSTLNSAV